MNKDSTSLRKALYEPNLKSYTHISNLYDKSVYEPLLSLVEESTVPSDIKDFLKLACLRFIKFKYKDIADYYCNETLEVQNLFEKNGLVIIDNDNKIEKSFETLEKEIENYKDTDYDIYLKSR